MNRNTHNVVNRNTHHERIIMNHLRKIILILFIVVPFAIIILIRETGKDHFRHNAPKRAEAAFNRTNILTWEKLQKVSSPLIVDLSEDGSLLEKHPESTVHIPVSLLLERSSLKIIRHHKGPVILYSQDPGTSAKAWMLLSEMGYGNLFILAGDTDNEALKYEFRPDTAQSGTSS